ncbi:TPA: hypothetical protein KOQ25_003676 [Clostridioides difficile]|uniref:hypothetical protein n=1 Tax=Clostridioides difficile TaxID=1496 RepID=UPI00038D0356|nr:hypothetical protein [Clostridioides difficile]OFU12925.1 hypothetical protein HMPREF3080_05425 [Clostridium sp. HMSC19C11]EGT3709105.1 hypothetical protein [Clostridioides difficile]EGT3817464.1 hypothetical protein [Clostridioides difficile]EGT4083702.1 hypothetical protein [Clostridioides difficile]EGT4902476.1 hypothetical protein [Clostridioides difficile]
MANARVQVLNEVTKNIGSDGWKLCLQFGRYIYDDGVLEEGFRFIWRRPDGTLQAARGQARIPSFEIMNELMNKAKEDGWGENIGKSDRDN